ncbi:loricrin-like [Setaria italica]|uniref:loricrin-like n=1 Tax=Setaria italica TaxID=4555 RepID=UPI00064717EA|nr:loricrin-like [Setaria italica]
MGRGDGAEAVGGGDRNGSGGCSGEDGGSEGWQRDRSGVGGGGKMGCGDEDESRTNGGWGASTSGGAGLQEPATVDASSGGGGCVKRWRWMRGAEECKCECGEGCREDAGSRGVRQTRVGWECGSAGAKRHLLRLRRKKLGGRGRPGCAGAEAVALPAVFVDGKLLGGHDVGGVPGPSDSAILCCPQRQRPRRPTLRRTAESGGCRRRRAAAGDVAGA